MMALGNGVARGEGSKTASSIAPRPIIVSTTLSTDSRNWKSTAAAGRPRTYGRIMDRGGTSGLKRSRMDGRAPDHLYAHLSTRSTSRQDAIITPSAIHPLHLREQLPDNYWSDSPSFAGVDPSKKAGVALSELAAVAGFHPAPLARSGPSTSSGSAFTEIHARWISRNPLECDGWCRAG